MPFFPRDGDEGCTEARVCLVCCVKKLITGNQILSSWKTTVGKLFLPKTGFLNLFSQGNHAHFFGKAPG